MLSLLRRRASLSRALVRSIFIQTADTPNPLSLKFLPNETVLDAESGVFIKSTDAKLIKRSPLAQALFDVPGVEAVFLGKDFVTVNKEDNDNVTWDLMKSAVFSAMMEHYSSGKPALEQAVVEAPMKGAPEDDDDEVVAMIKELLATRIRPAVQEDGGDIYFDNFDAETGIVYLEMAGSCAGCPSSTVTLKQGVENMLRHYIPEVKAVMEVENDELMSSSRDRGDSLEARLRAAGIPRD